MRPIFQRRGRVRGTLPSAEAELVAALQPSATTASKKIEHDMGVFSSFLLAASTSMASSRKFIVVAFGKIGEQPDRSLQSSEFCHELDEIIRLRS